MAYFLHELKIIAFLSNVYPLQLWKTFHFQVSVTPFQFELRRKINSELQGPPYLLVHFSSLKDKKSGPKDTEDPVC